MSEEDIKLNFITPAIQPGWSGHITMETKITDGRMCICFGESQHDINVSTMNKNLKVWHERQKQMEADILL